LGVDDDRVELREASMHWGNDTYETQELVKRQIGRGGIHVAAIGPAGENGVRFSGIYCDHGRTAGRTGLGAVMGAKNLKAIAVHGTQLPPLANPSAYASLTCSSNRVLRQDNEARVLHELGTAGAANYSEYLGAMPARYYHLGGFDQVDAVSGATMADQILAGQSTCHACVIACGRVVSLGDGLKRRGPEYETICAFGPNLLIADLTEITRIGELCDRYGMDTISLGNAIGLGFRLFEKGIITVNDTGGVQLRWGDPEPVRQLVVQTAQREGLGEWLAHGARGLARHSGAEDEAV
jgi:aldehyde:ferredoxin oxidoreductase